MGRRRGAMLLQWTTIAALLLILVCTTRCDEFDGTGLDPRDLDSSESGTHRASMIPSQDQIHDAYRSQFHKRDHVMEAAMRGFKRATGVQHQYHERLTTPAPTLGGTVPLVI